jgi:hypothetical protein
LAAGNSHQITSHMRKYFQGRSRLLEHFPDIGGFLIDATGSLNSVSGRIPELVMFSEKQAEMFNFLIKNVAKKLLRPSATYRIYWYDF